PTFVHANPRPAEPPAPGGSVTVASFNVLNYFNGDGQGGGFPTARGAESLSEFDRQRDKIIPAIVGLGADVIGLMEIENDEGTYQAIQDLVNGLNALEGAGTYDFINTGIIGTDEIRVAMIYRPARVTPVGTYAILDNDVDPDYQEDYNRPALAQTFDQDSTGERFTVVVNHLKSKGSACPDDPDLDDGQGNCNQTRTTAMEVELNWLATDPTDSGDSDFLIIGDLNAYAKEDPIVVAENGGYTNLVNQFNGLYAYSYVYMGQSGYLDHALASASLVSQVANVAHWHINSDEPRALDYNEEGKSAGQLVSLYNTDAYRSSDHDPVVIGLYPFDFGDLAIGYGTAWHGGNGALRLGTGWTADPTFGLDTDNATDDGVTMEPSTVWEEGSTVRIYAQVTGGSGYLAGWFDWNNDGDFAGVLEKSVAEDVNEGPNTIDFVIPPDAGYIPAGREVRVRFRLYPSEPGTLETEMPIGGASSGEVEDSVWTPPGPTAVKLLSFTARPAASGTLLAWETASEHDNAGFNLYRSTTLHDRGVRLNELLIPSDLPGGDQGAAYDFLDTTVLPGVTYYYTLEDVDLSGRRTAHGPVTITLWRAYLPVVGR
ncbi:MAG: ExeM/NucH family extracellular endonuclease, partial [Chloroflexia bacterium]|nr:ExeM/NucH family extracellular endonuclease [Chloroflexia bacterium]